MPAVRGKSSPTREKLDHPACRIKGRAKICRMRNILLLSGGIEGAGGVRGLPTGTAHSAFEGA